MEQQERKIWQTPWGYPESVIVVGGILIIGLLLQQVIGPFDFFLLTRPFNLITGGLLLIISITGGLTAHRNSLLRWFSGPQMSVALLLSLMILTIIMGLTLQATNDGGSLSILGFEAMTCNWSFVLIYSTTLLSLGILIVRRLRRFRLRDYAFYLNHIGLWILLAASGLGYADMERYVMYVREGETEWRVYDEEENVKEMPIAIQLNNFDMDVYPPKLAIIDRVSGVPQPVEQADYFQIDEDAPNGKINGWEITLEEYIHEAIRNSDSTYREVRMPGATPAVRIRATKDGVEREGWVCGGSQAQIYMTLSLNNQYAVVMTTAEPRSFMSDIEAYSQDGDSKRAIVEVNKPLRMGSWIIYQNGYDDRAGRLSSYSSFELIYDPWLLPVYVGITLMMFGSVCMLWSGRKRKERLNELD